MPIKALNFLAAIVAMLALSGCGFQPIYATQNGASPVSSQISVARIIAADSIAPYIEDALAARIVSVDGVTPRYELYVQARERANRLAVQIDATATRYNYRLTARYWVRDSRTGKVVRGVSQVVTSYNIVNSQYSTLFAERTAVEKAARQLAEEIERDILIRFTRPEKERDDIDPEEFDEIIEEDDVLFEPRRRKNTDAKLPEDLYFLLPAEEQEDEIENDAEVSVETEAEDASSGASPDVPDPVVEE